MRRNPRRPYAIGVRELDLIEQTERHGTVARRTFATAEAAAEALASYQNFGDTESYVEYYVRRLR